MHEQHHPHNEPPHMGIDGSEKVGYGNPPKHTRFQKGISGNPKGRPKGNRNIKSLVREVYFEEVSITESGKRRSVPAIVAIAIVQRQHAINGSVRAAEWGLKQMKELDLAEEPSISDELWKAFCSRLNDSALDEWIALERRLAQEEENTKNKMN